MSNIYNVEVTNEGQTYTFGVAEDETILAVAERENITLPSSCNAGVCTTCAAKITQGEVEQGDGMGVSPELQAEGYALLCVAYPRSDLKIIAGKEDEVYDRQFGMSQK
ncbi:2Fe-2S iron-sulfur cluster binding domain-containing protein [Cyanobacterium stanieri LEGE 03274]|uniref:2Fe-2S iron-sulfur cluster binding domain-containing protein n=1 Tax=Cyanobacterium stanieri LEGE 03274 TaxID=1828756 RepID=A0ABR9V558_9CHRO|nr:2Fe-2S iron-sulfur cluster-binding protein [Cyanobacterium stanieri]MBE9223018.1 2Fe-2S iron-sulfur cluster binding domain-containing protein [Cyanobacterium stanieri LEGE 03274]